MIRKRKRVESKHKSVDQEAEETGGDTDIIQGRADAFRLRRKQRQSHGLILRGTSEEHERIIQAERTSAVQSHIRGDGKFFFTAKQQLLMKKRASDSMQFCFDHKKHEPVLVGDLMATLSLPKKPRYLLFDGAHVYEFPSEKTMCRWWYRKYDSKNETENPLNCNEQPEEEEETEEPRYKLKFPTTSNDGITDEKADKKENEQGEEEEEEEEEEEMILDDPVSSDQLKTLSVEQRRAFDQATTTSTSIFLTGEAGTGKTYVLRLIVQQLRSMHHPGAVAVVAPTGMAAQAIDRAQTVHSLLRLPPALYKATVERAWAYLKKKPLVLIQLQFLKKLVMDEMSMLSKELILFMDQLLRRIRNTPNQPFGGIQVIGCGDFYQLPPIATSQLIADEEPPNETEDPTLRKKVKKNASTKQSGSTKQTGKKPANKQSEKKKGIHPYLFFLVFSSTSS